MYMYTYVYMYIYIHIYTCRCRYMCIHESESYSVASNSLWPHGLYSTWNFPGQNNGVGNLPLLQGIFPTQESNQGFLHCRRILYQLSYQGSPGLYMHGGGLVTKSCPTLATPWTVACQALLSMSFSRQEYRSGLSFPSPYICIHIYKHTNLVTRHEFQT